MSREVAAGCRDRTGQGGAFGTAAELAGSSGAGNNDVTMVLHVSADHKSATVISIVFQRGKSGFMKIVLKDPGCRTDCLF